MKTGERSNMCVYVCVCELFVSLFVPALGRICELLYMCMNAESILNLKAENLLSAGGHV